MTLEQLRIFVAVAQREHVTQGARDLNLTQSATSAAIAALEARHAVKLFDRVGRRIMLTKAGEVFLNEARAVLARAAAAETVLADLAGLKQGSLALAASQTVANYWLPPLMQRYKLRHPGIALSLTIGNTETVAAAVHDGVADLGFVEGRIDDPHLAVERVGADEMVLVVAPGHPWADRGKIDVSRFSETSWLLREPGSGTRAQFEEALTGAGLSLDGLTIALELPSNEAICAAVAAGGGATMISRLVAEGALKTGSLVALDIAMRGGTDRFALWHRDFLALRHKERHLTQAVRAFYALISEAVSGKGPSVQATPSRRISP
ncbi:LysR family transcriptional regulator [Bosea lathyri]|uniref:DNA-binding transcriptional regulator, LysR family n=1 Tax=Bosea lathyri TaxID=1036778 RepID=A0A1H6D037_9HYPH|nr:LysR family transcriptional regulator [Bosea lathyri]SEG78388.1 DNA-binding transcriptional regulator, LysR family [Bosea lathyri]